uniref:secretory calcium-binding phosphoprotein 7 n=1 Tax=Semicossyphus pulcher TaxID=241346 RepID=UPI0037E8D93D
MKFILVAACILGMAVCAPPQMYMEFDIHYAPAEAIQAIPAGAAPDSLDVLLPVDAQGRPLAGPGYIKQEILQANGRTKDVYFPFGFNTRTAPAAPVDPAAPAAAPVDPLLQLLLTL